MQLFRNDRDGDLELTGLGWLVVPLATTIVVGCIYQFGFAQRGSNSESAGQTAASSEDIEYVAQYCRGNGIPQYDMDKCISSSLLNIDTIRMMQKPRAINVRVVK